MLTFYDTEALERALALPCDAMLRRLLGQRVDHLNALDFDVRDTTYFVVVEADTSGSDLVDELGWSPLVNPYDGAIFGTDAFRPFHDFLADRGGWFELIVSAGNDAVFVLLVQDANGTDSALLALCRTHAGEHA